MIREKGELGLTLRSVLYQRVRSWELFPPRWSQVHSGALWETETERGVVSVKEVSADVPPPCVSLSGSDPQQEGGPQ